jgi:hypothetical protein
MTRTLATALAAAVLIASGLLHGLQTSRWRISQELRLAAERLKTAVPETLGQWSGQDQPMDPREASVAQFTGFIKRNYTEAKTGRTVSLLLAVGPPGPISVHTPEFCFVGAGFEEVGEKKRVSARGGNVFWMSDFKPQTGSAESLRVFYAWSTDGAWVASGASRLDFAASPYLYKLYLVRNIGTPGEPTAGDAALDFAEELLPVLTRNLRPKAD